MIVVCKNRIAQVKSFPRLLVLSGHKVLQEHSGCLLIQYGAGHMEEKQPLTSLLSAGSAPQLESPLILAFQSGERGHSQ